MFSTESAAPHGERRAKARVGQYDPAALTRRERVVLAEMARGFDNPTIAEHLCLTRSTLSHYVSSIYAKLGVTTRVRAVLLARERGWTDPNAEWTAPKPGAE